MAHLRTEIRLLNARIDALEASLLQLVELIEAADDEPSEELVSLEGELQGVARDTTEGL